MLRLIIHFKYSYICNPKHIVSIAYTTKLNYTINLNYNIHYLRNTFTIIFVLWMSNNYSKLS